MAITFLGAVTGEFIGRGSNSIDLTGLGLQEGDVLTAFAVVANAFLKDTDFPAEWTVASAVRYGPSYVAAGTAGHETVGATPPTEVALSVSGGNSGVSLNVVILAWRGVASVSGISTSTGGTPAIQPPQVTVEEDGSLAVLGAGVAYASNSWTNVTFDAAGLSDAAQANRLRTYPSAAIMGGVARDAGVFTPAALSITPTGLDEIWVTSAIVLTPAAAPDPDPDPDPVTSEIPPTVLPGHAAPVSLAGAAPQTALAGAAPRIPLTGAAAPITLES